MSLTSGDVREMTTFRGSEANVSTARDESCTVEGKLTWSLIVAVLALVIGSSFQLIEDFIRETSFFDNPERFDAAGVWIWASIVSAFPFGAIFGSLFAATLADTYGRKATLFFNNIPTAVAGSLMIFAYPFKLWYLLLIGRLIIGVSAGLTLFPVIAQLILLKFCPESPRYTLVFEGDEMKAEKDLIALRGKSDNEPRITFNMLFTRKLRWATFIATFLMFMQQMTGINAAIYYSNSIFESTGLVADQVVAATCAVMLANVLMTFVSTSLVDHPRFGRRSLLLTGMLGMFFTSIAIVIALVHIEKKNYVTESRIGAIVFMVLFVIAFSTGPGAVTNYAAAGAVTNLTAK
uniref:Major facilitator superfamily (MFS) profile domain-containing protein n=1 Tax=Parascaris univalens TaxID=6257 RepID=A0A915AGI1_PARUN